MKLSIGAVAALIITFALVAGAAPAAHADEAPTPTPAPSHGLGSADSSGSNTATPSPTPTENAEAPKINSPAAGSFISGPANISGTKAIDDELQLFSEPAAGDDPVCVVHPGRTHWSCSRVPLPSGPAVKLKVVVTGDEARSDSTQVAVLNPPTIAGAGGTVVSNSLVHGSAYPGATVTAHLSNGPSCTFTADASGNWACVLGGTTDGNYTISATQVGPAGFPRESSTSSAALPIRIDTAAPAAPVLTAPASGSRIAAGTQTTYSGTGESGAKVTVWAATSHGSTNVCSSDVTAGTWSCTANALPTGRYSVSALQQDAAGNTSAASAGAALRFEASTPSPGTNPPKSGKSGPGATNPPSTPSSPASPSAPGTTTPTPGNPGAPPGAPPGASNDALPPILTPFTAAIQPVSSAGSLTGWLQAGLFALVALALLAVPSRMLAGTIATARSDTRARPFSIFGRNQAKAELDESPTVHTPARWLVAGGGLLAASALATLSEPVAGQLPYFRLLGALLLALAVVNACSVAAPIVAARRFTDTAIHAAFAPYTLLLVASASLLSRVLQLQPALLFGAIVVVTVTAASAAARGKLAVIQIGSLAILAAIGWLIVGLLPAPSTVAAAFASEFVNGLTLSAIGSAAVLLLPLGNLPGRAILRWSWGIWLGTAVAVDTVLFAILVPITQPNASGPGTILFAVCTFAFAAISMSVWIWQRYIAPALR